MLAPGCEEAVWAAAAAEDGPPARAKEKVLIGAVMLQKMHADSRPRFKRWGRLGVRRRRKRQGMTVAACKGERRPEMQCEGISLGARASVGLAAGCKIGCSEDDDACMLHALSSSSRRLLGDHAEPQCSRTRHGICASVTGVAAKVVEVWETHGSPHDTARMTRPRKNQTRL